MGFIKWLLGKKEESSEIDGAISQEKQEEEKQEEEIPEVREESPETKLISVSKVTPSSIPEGSTVVAESQIPEYCSIGNLVFEKKYKEAVELGLKLLEATPNDAGVFINLMDAYFKGKETTAPDYLDKSTYYAKQAIIYGHNTGYAEERLAKNLDKAKLFHQSLQLYNLILETEGFHFSSQGYGNYIDWNHRRDAVLKKMDKALDTETDVLFTPEEIVQIIQSIKDNDDRERRKKERYDRIMAEIETALKNGEHERCDKLFKELHKPLD